MNSNTATVGIDAHKDDEYASLRDEIQSMMRFAFYPSFNNKRDITVLKINRETNEAIVAVKYSAIPDNSKIEIGGMYPMLCKYKKYEFEIVEIENRLDRYVLTLTNPRAI